MAPNFAVGGGVQLIQINPNFYGGPCYLQW